MLWRGVTKLNSYFSSGFAGIAQVLLRQLKALFSKVAKYGGVKGLLKAAF